MAPRQVKKAKPNAVRQLVARMSKEANLPDDEKSILLAGGYPLATTFEKDLVARAQSIQNRGWTPDIFQYGATAGWKPFLDFIVGNFFTQTTGISISSTDEVIVTPGSQNGIFGFNNIFENSNGVILTTSPVYLGAISAWNVINPCEIDYLKVEKDGIDPDQLEFMIEKYGAENIKVLYLHPSHSNPDVHIMSEEKRQRVVKIAHENNIRILEDDAYGQLSFPGFSLPPNLRQIEQEMYPEEYPLVTYLMTFSKTLGGGLRLALMNGSPDVISAQSTLMSGEFAMPVSFPAIYALDWLKTEGQQGFMEHIGGIQEIYANRANLMMNAIDTHLPEFVTYDKPKGGLFVWPTLNPEIELTSDELLTYIEKHNHKVAYIVGSAFGPDNETSFRLNYSNAPDDSLLEEGIRRIGQAIRECKEI